MSFIKIGNTGGGTGLGGNKKFSLGHVELVVLGVMQVELLSRQVTFRGRYGLEIWSGKLPAKRWKLKI